jgi:hypothetical protein
MADLEISCGCGQLAGVIRNTGPGRGSRIICYCRDCQAAAHHLGHPEALDEWGGTDLFITTPECMEVSAGADKLACFRFSPNAPRRWYTTCCNTHIGNSPQDAAVPFISLNLSCTTPSTRAVIGEATRGMVVRDAHGNPPVATKIDGMSRRLVFEVLIRTLLATLRGKRGATPFIREGKPIAEALMLNREVRAEALARAGF